MTDKAKAMWAARRAVVENYGVPIALLARACGATPRSFKGPASSDGWNVPVEGEEHTRAARIARVSEKLLSKVEKLNVLADEDTDPSEKDVSELSGAIKLLAKIADNTHNEDNARERQMTRDADIAAILERLDGKIIELARHLSEALAQEGIFDAGAGARQS